MANIGKAAEEQLMRLGIETPESLPETGAKAAWLQSAPLTG